MSNLPVIPVGSKVLIKPTKIGEKTKGGIYLAESTKDKEEAGAETGEVLAIAPECWHDSRAAVYGVAAILSDICGEDESRYRKTVEKENLKQFKYEHWCKVGDTIMYARYAGKVVVHQGERYLLMNDCDVMGVVPLKEGS